jgi:drug/metabolite transporter (DMT)-like permease
MTWILWGAIGALLLASVGIFARMNPWNQGLLGLLMAGAIPIMAGNAASLGCFIKAPKFVVAFFIFTGLYAMVGAVGSVFVFHEKISWFGWIGILMIVGGSILLRR